MTLKKKIQIKQEKFIETENQENHSDASVTEDEVKQIKGT